MLCVSMKKGARGFSLIELLVVITCLILLAVIVTRTVENAIPRARDARVISEFSDLQKGLAAFYALYQVYPCGDNWVKNPADNLWYNIDTTVDGKSFLQGNVDPANQATVLANCPGVQFGLDHDHFIGSDTTKPIDHPHPGGNPWTYSYLASADRKKYIMWTTLEASPNVTANDGGLCPNLYEVGNGLGVIKPMTDYWSGGGTC